MARPEVNRTIFSDVIEEHLALRARNARLEGRMPLADYLPPEVPMPTPERLTPVADWSADSGALWGDVDVWRDAA